MRETLPRARNASKSCFLMLMIRSAMAFSSRVHSLNKFLSRRITATIDAPWIGGLEYIGLITSFSWLSTLPATSADLHTYNTNPLLPSRKKCLTAATRNQIWVLQCWELQLVPHRVPYSLRNSEQRGILHHQQQTSLSVSHLYPGFHSQSPAVGKREIRRYGRPSINRLFTSWSYTKGSIRCVTW